MFLCAPIFLRHWRADKLRVNGKVYTALLPRGGGVGRSDGQVGVLEGKERREVCSVSAVRVNHKLRNSQSASRIIACKTTFIQFADETLPLSQLGVLRRLSIARHINPLVPTRKRRHLQLKKSCGGSGDNDCQPEDNQHLTQRATQFRWTSRPGPHLNEKRRFVLHRSDKDNNPQD